MKFNLKYLPENISFWKCLLVLLLWIPSHSSIQAQKIVPYTIHYDIEGQTTATVIHSVAEDSLGLVWLATDKGILRFDGVTFRQYDLSHLSPSNEFYGFSKDTNGTFWFFSADRLLVAYDTKRDQFYPSPLNDVLKSSVSGVIYTIYWTKNDIYLDCSSRKTIHLFKENSHGERSKWQLEDLDNTLILFVNGQYEEVNISFKPQTQLYSLFGDTLFEQHQNSAFGYSKRSIFETEKSTWTACSQALIQVDHFGKLIAQHSFEGLQTPRGLIEDSEKRIWLALFKKGVVVFNFHQDEQFLSDTLFRNQTITSFFENSNKDLWISTLNNGFYYLPKKHLVKHAFLNEPLYYTGSFDSTDLVITKSGQIFRKEKNDLGFELFGDILFEPTSIQKLNKDTLMTISTRGYSYIYRSNSEVEFDFTRHKLGRTTFVYSQDGKPAFADMVKAESDSLIFIQNNNLKKIEWPKKWSIPKMKICNKRGDIFFANYNGLHAIYNQSTGGITSIEENKGLQKLKRIILCHFIDDDQIRFIDHSGVFIWNMNYPDSIETILKSSSFDVKSFQASDSINWAGTTSGLRKFTSKTKSKIQYIISLNEKAKVVNGFLKEGSEVKLATNDGFFEMSKADTHIQSRIKFYEIRNGKNVQLDPTSISLPSDSGNLNISWSNFDYLSKLKRFYRWRLAQNDDWTATTVNNLSLNSVGFGNYTIEVQILNLDNEWSQSASLNFQVERPYYLQLPFLVICFILLSLLILLIIQVRSKAIEEQYLLKENLLTTQNQALASQLNPHFIFNSMNTVSSFIAQEDDKNALKYISKLSSLMRSIFANAQKPSVSLQEELNSVFDYIEMEQLRFGDKLKFEFVNENNTNLAEIRVPSMLIQPFVENAIKHAILVREKGGSLVIKIEEENEKVHVLVQDDGPGIDKVAAQKRKEFSESSMSAIQRRLNIIQSLKQEGAMLNVLSSEKGVTVKLTFKKTHT